MIAAHILIQVEVGPSAIVTAALAGMPGVSETACVAVPRDVIARAATRHTGERAKQGTSRARVCGGGTRTGGCPVAHR